MAFFFGRSARFVKAVALPEKAKPFGGDTIYEKYSTVERSDIKGSREGLGPLVGVWGQRPQCFALR